MTLLRFILLAGVIVAIGLCAPTRALASHNAATPPALSGDTMEPLKAETPPRPRPKPGPKDGGEDE